MNLQQIQLYERIQAFSFDQPDAYLPFSKRLARDNSWSLEYTQRVIEEYKKFAFLAVIATHPVTPSDQVDQVWHLHLSYTRSYWEEFCPQVLQMTLHHDPTRGGQTENQKFDDWYSKTLESYEQFFGQAPPMDIWPTSDIRFGRDLHFIRVNTEQNWVFSKVQIRRRVTTGVSFISLILLLSGCYIGNSASYASPIVRAIPGIICIVVGIGFIRLLIDAITFLKNPKAHRISGYWMRDDNSGGCGFGGSGEFGHTNFSGHHSHGDSGNCGDSGGSDSGSSGCGGGGCGGGGCGGGGCGGGGCGGG